MKRFLTHLVVALITFCVGATAGAAWHAKRNHLAGPAPIQAPARTDKPQQEEPPWSLYPRLVSRALQTRQISTKRLRRNSDDEIVWRWLRQEIDEYQFTAGYTQRSLVLPVSETHDYFAVIESSTQTPEYREYVNRELRKEGRAALQANRRYGWVEIHIDNIECPEWSGVIDLEAPKLVFFRGSGA